MDSYAGACREVVVITVAMLMSLDNGLGLYLSSFNTAAMQLIR